MSKSSCPMCKRAYRALPSPLQRTSDHILPRIRGGGASFSALGVRNSRWLCGECNLLSAVCFHCPVTVACVRSVSGLNRARVRDIIRAWKIGQAHQTMDLADRARRYNG